MNLGALNSERVTEEARGVVRWLRPDHQAPETVQPVSTRILNFEPEFESSTAIGALMLGPWPIDLKLQLAALREAMLYTGKLWSLEAVAQAYKSIGPYLDSIGAHPDLPPTSACSAA